MLYTTYTRPLNKFLVALNDVNIVNMAKIPENKILRAAIRRASLVSPTKHH